MQTHYNDTQAFSVAEDGSTELLGSSEVVRSLLAAEVASAELLLQLRRLDPATQSLKDLENLFKFSKTGAQSYLVEVSVSELFEYGNCISEEATVELQSVDLRKSSCTIRLQSDVYVSSIPGNCLEEDDPDFQTASDMDENGVSYHGRRIDASFNIDLSIRRTWNNEFEFKFSNFAEIETSHPGACAVNEEEFVNRYSEHLLTQTDALERLLPGFEIAEVGVTDAEPLLQALLLHDASLRQAFCQMTKKMLTVTASASEAFVATLQTLLAQSTAKRLVQKR